MYEAPLPLPELPRPRPIRFVLCALANLALVSSGLTALFVLVGQLSSFISIVLAMVLVAALASAVQRMLWWEGHPALLRWVAVGVLGWTAGLIATTVFIGIGGGFNLLFTVGLLAPPAHGVPTPEWLYPLGALLGGVIAGGCQSVLLRRYMPGRLWWVPLSAISWGLGLYFMPILLLGVDF